MKISARTRSAEGDPGVQATPEVPRSGVWGVVALVIVGILLVAAFIFIAPGMPNQIINAGSALFSKIFAIQPNSSTGGPGSTQTYDAYSPLILNGTANITYPSDYSTLANYALGLINQDRQNFGLTAVTLSPIQSGQQHTDSMLRYSYFSHYDTQGYKPYMRYTLLGGSGAVVENIAYVSYSSPHYSGVSTVEADIKLLESSMMYNDSVCCNNGHRLNILSPLHNRVSIGVSYDSTTLYFAEDFENYYVSMNTSVSKTGTVTMQGSLLDSGIDVKEAFIAFDPTPEAQTAQQLNAGPREYDPGNLSGGVLPPCTVACPTFTTGITAYASSWQFSSSRVYIVFSLADFINKLGPGVYTIYLVTGSSTDSAITSTSLFVA